jgi:uncharacterized metal-binding protein YceD (DUF177 family)
MEEFEIEFVKLENGIHLFEYQINASFFDFFKNIDINSANVLVKLELNKLDNVLQIFIQGAGVLQMTCDRCLGNVDYPVDNEFTVIYNLNAAEDKTEEAHHVNMDLFYVKGSQFSVNVAESIYQSFLTEIPMVKRCDDIDNGACDDEMINKIENLERSNEQKLDIDPRWDDLKKLLNKEK